MDKNIMKFQYATKIIHEILLKFLFHSWKLRWGNLVKNDTKVTNSNPTKQSFWSNHVEHIYFDDGFFLLVKLVDLWLVKWDNNIWATQKKLKLLY